MKKWVAVCFILSLFLKFSGSVSAQEVIFSDNFDDGDTSNWTVQRNMQYWDRSLPCYYQGRPANWKILDGWFGIEIYGPSCTTEITPNGVDLSNLSGFEYEFDWKLPDSTYMDRNGLFEWHDPKNWYDIKLLDNSILMQKVVAGEVYGIGGNAATYPFEANKSYHFKISFTPEKQIIVHINGQQVMQMQDEEPFISGSKTVGLQASVGSIARSVSYFDNLVVRSLDKEPGLAVPVLKQTDVAWAQLIYDSAQSWSHNPTINRWGCAITSMAMIMKYHGLNQTPDGQEVNPATLNDWLKSQPDGYVGEGLTNWLAVTRLTRLISEKLGTPKLEYRRVDGASLAAAKQEIEESKPVILQIAGHFLVGYGVTNNGLDLIINDPAYPYKLLSMHNTALLSTRLFQPSHTDLSYLMLAHDPNLKVTVTKNDGQQPAGIQEFSDYMKDKVGNTGERSPLLQLHELAKPIADDYVVTVSQDQVGPFELQIFAYDRQGNPTMLYQTGEVGPEPMTFVIEYNPEGGSRIKPSVSFSSLRADLKRLWDLGQIRKQATYQVLDRFAEFGERATQPSQLQAIKSLQTMLKAHAKTIDAESLLYLTQQIELLAQSL